MLGTKHLFADCQRTLLKHSYLGIISECPSSVTCEPVQNLSEPSFRPLRGQNVSVNQRERVRVESPRPRPSLRIGEGLFGFGVNNCQRLHKSAKCSLSSLGVPPYSRDLTYEAMQPYCFSSYRRVTFVLDYCRSAGESLEMKWRAPRNGRRLARWQEAARRELPTKPRPLRAHSRGPRGPQDNRRRSPCSTTGFR